MFGALARKLFGSSNDRFVKQLITGPVVEANALEPQIQAHWPRPRDR